MRIAFVTGHYRPFAGGVETHVEQIASRLAARGDDVSVLTQADDLSVRSQEVIEGVHVHRYPVPIRSRHFAVSPGLGRALRAQRQEWDIVHVHGYHSVVPLLAVMAGARPLVFTPHYHGTGHSPFRTLLHRPYRHLGALITGVSRRVISVSEAERALFVSHFPDAAGKTAVIPNGVDPDKLRAALPFSKEKTTIVSAGRLETYKNVGATLEAMAVLGGDYQLIVTGDGPDRARLEMTSRRLGLGDTARFLGRIASDDLYRWYRTADVYVSMSSTEAMGIAIIELLACGARVVASDIPAHREVNGLVGGMLTLVPLGASPHELATAIEIAAKAPPVEDARIPTWDEVTDATRAVYDEAIRRD
jgi:glycosyltransferase involved in cell wall biosynthesis